MPHISLPSPLGVLTLFEEEGALVAVEWGRACDTTSAATPLLRAARRQLDAYFDGALQAFDLPLSAAGTAFQRRVWDRLRDIPYGCTETYGTLARDLSTSPRALAGACCANPLPVIVPCHRVIGVGGLLGGYSGGEGVETKKALLRLEGTLGWEPALLFERQPISEDRT